MNARNVIPFFILATLAGCATLSGLDELGVCDACATEDGTASDSLATAEDANNAPETSTTPPNDASSKPDGSNVLDAGSEASTTSSCFKTKCTSPEVCCLESNGSSASCDLSCPSMTVELSCTLPSDCPNSHCCAKIPSQDIVSASCSASCENILCIVGQDSGCPGSDDCLNMGNVPQGFGICF